MTDRSEPTTDAGKDLLRDFEDGLPEIIRENQRARDFVAYLPTAIARIEAEAAQPASASGLRELLARAVSGTGGPYTHEFVPGASRAASLTTEWTCQQCGYSELVSASPAAGLLDAALRLRLLELTGQDHPHDPLGQCGTCEAYLILAALPSPSDPPALAQPSASIDVERLAQALFYSIGPGNLNGYPYDDEYRAIFRENADDTLAEYARLSAQPEAQPAEDADAVER